MRTLFAQHTKVAAIPLVVGRHMLADMWGCDPLLLNDQARIVKLIKTAAVKAGATVLAVNSHQFEPQGVTAIVLLAESHIAIHTWPEHGYAAVDVMTCGSSMQPQLAVQAIERALKAQSAHVTNIKRGIHL